MNERIKKLRKALGLTQQEFADKLSIKRNTVATYESGKSNPSDAAVILICKTFDVSETWLRTGEGEMLLAKPAAVLDALAAEHHLTDGDYVLIEKFLALKPEARKAMIDYMKEVVASITAMENEGSSYDTPDPTIEEQALAEAERHTQLLYEQILAEKKAQAGLSSGYSGPLAGDGTANRA